MSTKRHHGYRIAVTDLAQLHAFSTRVQALMRKKADQLMRRRIGVAATMLLDEQRLGKRLGQPGKNSDYATISPIGYANVVASGAAEDIRRTQHRDPVWDFEVSWTILPHRSGTLALFFSEQREFTAIWQAQTEVSEFAYWNNTDPEPGMSRAEWTKRGRIWDQALPTGIPATSGFSFTVYATYDAPGIPRRPSDLLVPSHRVRSTQLGSERARTAWIHAKRPIGKLRKSAGFSLYMDWMREYAAFVATPEGAKYRNGHIQDVRRRLPVRWAAAAYRTPVPLLPRVKDLPVGWTGTLNSLAREIASLEPKVRHKLLRQIRTPTK